MDTCWILKQHGHKNGHNRLFFEGVLTAHACFKLLT
jgi:hypothetical protein